MIDLSYFQDQVETLQKLLDSTRDRRVCAVGTKCCGKSYLVNVLRGAYDMDKLIFPLLTESERKYICQDPWTPEIGETIKLLIRERVKIEAGKAVFGTVVLASDFLIYLRISEWLLRKRTISRTTSYDDAMNMQKEIEEEVQEAKRSGIQTIELLLG